MHQYKLVQKKGEGTFSEVFQAQSLKTGNQVAIKCMKSHFNNIEQVQRLREIQALKKVSLHQHIIKLIEVLYDEPTGRLALVFELMDQNLYESIRGRKTYLNQQKVKYIMYQLIKAIDHIHKKGIFHRDIKPENILLIGDQVKLADFGSCKGIFSEHPYTEYISTRWYRAPECLLTDGYYDQKMDIWGAGCIMFEILSLFPLFPGDNELDQVHKIHKILGTPNRSVLERFQQRATHMEFDFPDQKGTGIAKLIPFVSREAIDLIQQLLIYDPNHRITATQALQHPYFRDITEMEQNSIRSNNLSHSLSPQKYQNLSVHKDPNLTLRGPGKLAMYQNKPGKKKPQYRYGKNINNSNSNNNSNLQNSQSNNQFDITSTQKFQDKQKYKGQYPGEYMFYPVLSIKKAKKKKKMNFGQQTQYTDFHIHGNKDSGTEDDNSQYSGLLPPIKYQQSMGGFPDHSVGGTLGAGGGHNHPHGKMGMTHVSAKYRDYSNPFKVSKKKKDSHFSSTNTIVNDYLIQASSN